MDVGSKTGNRFTVAHSQFLGFINGRFISGIWVWNSIRYNNCDILCFRSVTWTSITLVPNSLHDEVFVHFNPHNAHSSNTRQVEREVTICTW